MDNHIIYLVKQMTIALEKYESNEDQNIKWCMANIFDSYLDALVNYEATRFGEYEFIGEENIDDNKKDNKVLEIVS